MSDLTPKQRKWLEEYLICWNATEAARRAGYKNDRVSGHRNVTNDNIRAEIDRHLTKLGMSAEEVVARLADHAKGDLSDFFKVDPVTGFVSIDMKKAEESGKLHLVKKMKFNKSGFLESIELHDPQAALVHLGKVHGVFKDVVEHSWKDELEKQGLNPSDVFEKLVQSIASNIPASAKSVNDGGDG